MAGGRREQVAAVTAIVGSDRFLRGEALRALLGRIPGTEELGAARFEGGDVELAEVLDEVRTPTLLGGRRAAVVDNADAFVSRFRERLERYCAAPSPDGYLMLLCDSLPKNQRIYKAIAALDGIVAAEAPKGAAMTSWIVERARSVYGKRVSRETAESLRAQAGDAPGALDTELSKLATYAGGREEIGVKDVAALTDCRREEIIFAVMDALADGGTAEALAKWEQVLATDRSAPGRALAGLAWAVRGLLAGRRELDEGGNVYAMAKRKYVDPQVLRGRLERWTAEQLARMQKDLLEADVAMKVGEATAGAAIESWIVKWGEVAAAV